MSPATMVPVGVHWRRVGSYRSATFRYKLPGFQPPATSTRPLASRVAVCALRPTGIGLTACQELGPGLKTSALATTPPGTTPPVTSTWPLASTVTA